MSMPSRIKNAAEPRVVAIRDALWAALRAGSVQTYADLRTQCGGSADDVRCWTSLWRRAGILWATPQGLEMLPEYRVQETPPPASAFRGRTIMARSWDAIRVLKRFTVQDLELAAQITPRAARAHISTLRRAGYASIRAPMSYGYQSAAEDSPNQANDEADDRVGLFRKGGF